MHRHADVREAVLLLRVHAHVVRRLDRDRRERVVLELLAELRLDPLPDAFRPDVVDHELHPGLDARDAVLQVFRPHRRGRAEELVRALLGDEDAHVPRDARHGGEAAADDDAEALAAVVVNGADQRDAVDLRRVAAVGCTRRSSTCACAAGRPSPGCRRTASLRRRRRASRRRARRPRGPARGSR